MKNTRIIAFLLIALSFYSCDEDEECPPWEIEITNETDCRITASIEYYNTSTNFWTIVDQVDLRARATKTATVTSTDYDGDVVFPNEFQFYAFSNESDECDFFVRENLGHFISTCEASETYDFLTVTQSNI
ncbi:MAG: hypothetical protein JXR07_07720 [Reichenbachiella sp.]